MSMGVVACGKVAVETQKLDGGTVWHAVERFVPILKSEGQHQHGQTGRLRVVLAAAGTAGDYRLPLTAIKGLGPLSTLVRRGAAPLIPPKGRGSSARVRASCHSRCV